MTNRILVVCYSRGGTTLRVAKHLAKTLNADLDTIEEYAPRAGLAGYARSLIEAVAKGVPSIRTRHDPRDYDLVVIGTPVWAGTMSSPVRSYLFAHAGQLRNAAFFAVMGGRGAEDTVREMQIACGARHALTCCLTQGDVERDRYRERCQTFVDALQNLRGTREERHSEVA